MKPLQISKEFAKKYIQLSLLNYDTGLNGISWKSLIGTKNDIDVLIENPLFIEEIEDVIMKVIVSEDKSMETTLKNLFKLKYLEHVLNEEQLTILQERCNGGLKGVKLKDPNRSKDIKYDINPLKEIDIKI
jgi:hypothetical protein